MKCPGGLDGCLCCSNNDELLDILRDLLKTGLQCRSNVFPCVEHPNEDPCPECRVRQAAEKAVAA